MRRTIMAIAAFVAIVLSPLAIASAPAQADHSDPACEESSLSESSFTGEVPEGCYVCPDGTFIHMDSTMTCDVCLNLEDHQYQLPEGYEVDEAGICTLTDEPPAVCTVVSDTDNLHPTGGNGWLYLEEVGPLTVVINPKHTRYLFALEVHGNLNGDLNDQTPLPGALVTSPDNDGCMRLTLEVVCDEVYQVDGTFHDPSEMLNGTYSHEALLTLGLTDGQLYIAPPCVELIPPQVIVRPEPVPATPVAAEPAFTG